MGLYLRNGRVIDPSQNIDRKLNIRIEGSKIIEYDDQTGDRRASSRTDDDIVVDAAGKIIVPGLIDLHVHLREPGQEEDETIETGVNAAMHGGFTSICCCPNTQPPLDTQATIKYVKQKAARFDRTNVFVICCVSKNREGKELAELGRLFETGAVACSDDGSPVEDAELMRRALEYCLMFKKPVFSHPEVKSLTQGGVMHEGKVSLQLGLRGMPSAAEDVMVSRDITLAEITGGHIHIMHVSTEGAVQAIRRAKQRKVHVTAETTPHHLILTDESLRNFESIFKMSPPLRSAADVAACVEAVKDGTIDAIATDHAPHAPEKKIREIDQAPFGVIGLETALPLMITRFVNPGIWNWTTLVERMSVNPARILQLPNKGTLRIGADADVTIIDPEHRWTVEEHSLHSKSKNSPFLNWNLTGKASAVVIAGKLHNLLYDLDGS